MRTLTKIKGEREPSTKGFRSFTAKAARAFAAVSFIGLTFVTGQESGGRATGDRTARTQMREWAEKRFPHLVRPDFAKLELARMLPELREDPARLVAPFKVGEALDFRLLVTNGSSEKIDIPIAGPYEHNRPRLFKGTEAIPYRQDVEKMVRSGDTQRGYMSVRYEQFEPGLTLTEVVKLNDWYDPLRPGSYRLMVRHRFILGGDWVDSPPINFEVIP